MKAKYDIPAIHAKCLEWCKNPVFPYHWQHAYEVVRSPLYDFQIIGHGNCLAILDPKSGSQTWQTICEFAYLIGLDVESYRIKETYKSAVERYLSTIGEGQLLWEGSIFIKSTIGDGFMVHARHQEYLDVFVVWKQDWEDSDRFSQMAYYFLRLDLNPDYQVG